MVSNLCGYSNENLHILSLKANTFISEKSWNIWPFQTMKPHTGWMCLGPFTCKFHNCFLPLWIILIVLINNIFFIYNIQNFFSTCPHVYILNTILCISVSYLINFIYFEMGDFSVFKTLVARTATTKARVQILRTQF